MQTKARKRKPFGAKISEEIADNFTKDCEKYGFVKYRALEAALRTFLALPPSVQVIILDKNIEDIYALIAK